MEDNISPGSWIWEKSISRVWTDPRHPSQGLGDSLMDNDLLA